MAVSKKGESTTMKRDAEEASLSDSEALKTKVKMSDSDKDEGAETASKEMDEQQAFTNVTKAKTPEHEETVAVSPTLSEEGEVADLKPDENMAIDQDEEDDDEIPLTKRVVRKPKVTLRLGRYSVDKPRGIHHVQDMDIDIDNIPEPNWDIHEPIIEGFVLWWSNLHGRGQIKEIGGNEEVLTIYAWDIIPIYGALLTGVTVQYQRTENRNFKNFRVKRGMGCVLFEDVRANPIEYPYADLKAGYKALWGG